MAPTLADRLGLELGAPETDRYAACLVDAAETALTTLSAAGQLRDGAHYTELALPPSYAELLGLGIAAARAVGDEAHASLLEMQYLQAMPLARVRQLATSEAPAAALFHTPIAWGSLPGLSGALDRLEALLETHGVSVATALGVADAQALRARFSTLAAGYATTYFGGLQPMFAAHDAELGLIAREADDAGDLWAAVDHRLGAAVLHELLHFGRDREAAFPPYLDEAIAGYLGAALLPSSAFPAPGDDNALVGWPWFSQVGQALVRGFGMRAVLAAQAGVVPWRTALPAALIDTFERLAWRAYRDAPAAHFHPDTRRPDRWVRLIYAAAAGVDVAALQTPADLDELDVGSVSLADDPARDREIVVHALTTACLATRRVADGTWRVSREPPAGPVVLDFPAAECRAPARPDGAELAPARHALPPGLGALGQRQVVLTDTHPDTLAMMAEAVLS